MYINQIEIDVTAQNTVPYIKNVKAQLEWDTNINLRFKILESTLGLVNWDVV